jgi:ribonuclease D
VRGRGGLRSKGLAILRELAAWREEEAQRRNKPRGGILSDEVLVELARRSPDKPGRCETSAASSPAPQRHSAAIIAAVKRALQLPQEEWPQVVHGNHGPAPSAGVTQLLQAVLRLSSEESGIAPTLVATSADLHALVEAFALGKQAELPLLSDGATRSPAPIWSPSSGKAALRLEPKSQRVKLER